MQGNTVQLVGASIFGLALVHTFSVKFIERFAARFPRHAGVFHLLGEVEVVFGFWAIVLIVALALLGGGAAALGYAESRNYAEPLFVFVVMVVAASRPVLRTVAASVAGIARLAPLPTPIVTTWLGLAAVPLLGSLVTEPAAMTIAALILAPKIFRPTVPEPAKYLALGVLFVNVSIGGTLTSFAAPPVLMVAATWNWDSAYMFLHFGWKAALAVVVNASVATMVLRKPLTDRSVADDEPPENDAPVPTGVVLVHFALLAAIVFLAHHPVAFLGLFLMFLGFAQAYESHQNPLILREALLVGFFLAGLVVLGGMQSWWLQPIVSELDPVALFFGALGLTAITDNAALTYLGSLIQGISAQSQYMLVAGVLGVALQRQAGGGRWPDGDRQCTQPGRRGIAQARFLRRDGQHDRTFAGRQRPDIRRRRCCVFSAVAERAGRRIGVGQIARCAEPRISSSAAVSPVQRMAGGGVRVHLP